MVGVEPQRPSRLALRPGWCLRQVGAARQIKLAERCQNPILASGWVTGRRTLMLRSYGPQPRSSTGSRFRLTAASGGPLEARPTVSGRRQSVSLRPAWWTQRWRAGCRCSRQVRCRPGRHAASNEPTPLRNLLCRSSFAASRRRRDRLPHSDVAAGGPPAPTRHRMCRDRSGRGSSPRQRRRAARSDGVRVGPRSGPREGSTRCSNRACEKYTSMLLSGHGRALARATSNRALATPAGPHAPRPPRLAMPVHLYLGRGRVHPADLASPIVIDPPGPHPTSTTVATPLRRASTARARSSALREDIIATASDVHPGVYVTFSASISRIYARPKGRVRPGRRTAVVPLSGPRGNACPHCCRWSGEPGQRRASPRRP